MSGPLFEITDTPLSVDDVIARLSHPTVGGVNTFIGVVRGLTDGQETDYLLYEAYRAMAEEQLREIDKEIRRQWPTVRELAIVHRIGRLRVGEIIVVVAVSAAHRRETFAATRYAIDRLKQIVPIWKKEVWADGAEWKSEHGAGAREEPR